MVVGLEWECGMGRGLIDLIGGEGSAIIAQPPPQNSRFTMMTKMRNADKLICDGFLKNSLQELVPTFFSYASLSMEAAR